MTRALRKYVEQARELGACEGTLALLGSCTTVENALKRIWGSERAWVLAFMDVPKGTRQRVRAWVDGHDVAAFFGFVLRGQIPMPPAARRDQLLALVTERKAASRIRRILGAKLPKRWQDRLTRIAEEAPQ